jgi:hypothetical protein
MHALGQIFNRPFTASIDQKFLRINGAMRRAQSRTRSGQTLQECICRLSHLPGAGRRQAGQAFGYYQL